MALNLPAVIKPDPLNPPTLPIFKGYTVEIKTSELTGAALDWAVAKCEGFTPLYKNAPHANLRNSLGNIWHVNELNFSTNWAHGGPIIEREKIRLDTTWNQEDGHWSARMDTVGGWWPGDTPLIAAMRCYVAGKIGDTVDIPKELTKC